MTSDLALCTCILFILWLFARDRTLRPMTSGPLWLVLSWILIIGSRPVSYWLSGSAVSQIESPEGYLDGSPIDRNVFLLLIITGTLMLLKRRVDWGKLFSLNKWFFVFFIYFGISIIWSDFPYVGFKRWIKDIGNIVMVLLILTEKEPAQAIKAVFMRYIYVAIPLSIVLIKYFPEIGRYYNIWTWEVSYSGITYEKNTLGPIAFISGLFLVWDLIQMWDNKERRNDLTDLLTRVVLLLMAFWLVIIAKSSTALACLLLGIGIIFFMRLPLARRQIKYLGSYSLGVGFFLIFLYTVPGVLETFVQIVGRDTTLTGRTDLWEDVLKEPINPVLGTGYQSFWLGPRAERIWDKYYFHPNQAHNGYLETYLNGGLVGLCLLVGMIISGGRKLKNALLLGRNDETLSFTFFVLVLFSNLTEATLNRLSLVWLILIISVVNCPRLPEIVNEGVVRGARDNMKRAALGRQSKLRVSYLRTLNAYRGPK